MQFRWFCVTLMIGIVLACVLGCNDSNSSSATKTFAGTVQQGNNPLAGVTVTLFQNGTAVATPQTTQGSGAFSFTAPTSGTFVLQAVQGQIITFYGPFTSLSGNIVIDTTAPAGVTAPNDGTATAAAFATDTTGTPVVSQLIFQVDGLLQLPRANPGVVTGITPGTYPAYITDIGTQNMAIFPPTRFDTNTLTIFRGIVTPVSSFSLSGTVTNNGAPMPAGTVVARINTFNEGGRVTTTDANGQFTFTGVLPSSEFLAVDVSPSTAAVYGPLNFDGSTPAPVNFDVALGANVALPPNGFATIVVDVVAGAAPTDLIRVTADGLTTTGTSPVVLTPIPGQSATIVVTDLANNRSAVYPNYFFAQLNEFRAVLH